MMNLNRKMKHVFAGLILTAFAIGFLACGDDNSLEELRKNELAKLREYMQANYADVKPKSSGLYYIEELKGTGDSIVPGDRVQIFYSAYNLEGDLVDETNGFSDGYLFEPVQFKVVPASQLNVESANYISETPGLHEALTYMQLNSIATLILDSGLAFGQNGTIYTEKSIPGFNSIIIKVRVYKVNPAN